MKYISLKNKSLTYFNSKGITSELGGSSKYVVFDSFVDLREKNKKNKIESTSAQSDYIKSIIDTHSESVFVDIAIKNYKKLIDICITQNFNQTTELELLDSYQHALKYKNYFSDILFLERLKNINEEIDKKSIYFKIKKEKKTTFKLNKSKVTSKMYAFFNLKRSKRFVAFYTFTFPPASSDDECFSCLNAILTVCREKMNLKNYIWISERQKNNTIHFHLLTNDFMPIEQVNRALAIIIDNKVSKGKMSWSGSSLAKYNGVDVDSIYASKRHKKTGKTLNSTQLRQLISNYLTKYISKNNDEFTHLCYHSSRSVSMLFTSQLFLQSDSFHITALLPRLRNLYQHIKAEFAEIWIFLFEPPPEIFNRINYYNDLIFSEFDTKYKLQNSNINFKSINL